MKTEAITLTTHRYAFSDCQRAFEEAAGRPPTYLKGVIIFSKFFLPAY